MSQSEVTRGSGNVFADLGLPNSDELQLKSNLAIAIVKTIQERSLTQTEAARIMRETQPNVAKIMRGKLDGFSVGRLTRHLLSLGRDIQISVTNPHEDRRGHLTLSA